MDKIACVLSVVLALNIFYIDQVSSCDFVGLGQCNDILIQSGLEEISKGITTMPYGDQHRDVCGALKKFGQCYKSKFAQCNGVPSLEMTYGTIENTVNFLCEEGFEEIEGYAWCWEKPELSRLTKQCTETQNITAQSIQHQAIMGMMTQQDVRSQMCKMMSEASRCLEDATFSQCGAGPDCTMQTLLERGFRLVRETMGCSKSESCRK